ncbi:AAA family ATPase [Pediococcus pentosaceus]|uniref:AAA family ATPase n=1 Tax=Pediococcus pentosaceus TaxID=1255 RepID=UPI001F595040|nr:AAA family ATPase [Pediococcus pentosaceus]MCI2960311.1 AAA family ATPase [Pediococcus pentosaceus]
MTQYSYSRVDLFLKCPYHFKLRYIDKLTELPRFNADNPLINGHALHKGIEAGEDAMVEDYLNSYPVITNDQVNELIKLKILLRKVKEELSPFSDCKQLHEYRIITSNFIGFADLILVAPDKSVTIIDFKYSNNVKNYMDSGQLHLYKYYLEQQGWHIDNLAYMFIPKTAIKQKKDEDLFHFRKRLEETVEAQEVKVVPIDYDEMHVIYFHNAIKEIESATEYPRNPENHCIQCIPRFAPDYLETLLDEKGEITMQLPKNERREMKIDDRPDIWLYADSYVGKTTFMDKFDDVLMLNTDGNTDNITSPVLPIHDEVKKEGRMTKRTFAWENFLSVIEELEIENTENYKTIVIDLMEDLRDDCRNYIMDKYGWEHESDGSFGKGWSMVTKEFANAIKRLKAIGLQIVYISRELATDVNLKNGQVRTTYKPNIDDKTANFLTGTVDITMRAYVNDKDEHMLMLQKEPNIFGGGRFDFKEKEVPLERDAFLAAVIEAQKNRKAKTRNEVARDVDQSNEDDTESRGQSTESKPKRRTRKSRREEEAPEVREGLPEMVEEQEETPEVEEQPKRKRRSRKARKTTEEESVTPPGEDESEPESDVEPEPEEKPRRKRRARRSERKAD